MVKPPSPSSIDPALRSTLAIAGTSALKQIAAPVGSARSPTDATDMPANLLAYYAFVKVNEEEYDSAKQYFDKAKSKGLSKKYLTRYEMDEPTFKDFASALNTVGDIP